MAAVVLDGDRVIQITEKPEPGQAPSSVGSVACYVLGTRVLDLVPNVALSPRGELEFPDALRLLIEDGGVVEGLLSTGRMTLTGPSDLLALTSHYLRNDPNSAVVNAAIPQDTTVVPPVRIEAGTSVGSGCCIGPEVYCETGSLIGNGAVIEKSVVLGGGVVDPGSDFYGLVIHASD
jgi:NDP-sugar pyrophosphorylase family protein